MANKRGTNGNDIIDGTSVKDRLEGLGGNDILNGFEGNDELIGDDLINLATIVNASANAQNSLSAR